MIYDIVSEEESLKQGDILYPLLGMLHIDLDKLILVSDEGELQSPVKWTEIFEESSEFNAMVKMQKLIGIVASQDCDAERNDLISFFQIDTLVEVTGNQIPQRRDKHLNYLMEGAETSGKNKWFYLPESEKMGFDEKMAIDFEVMFQIPRKTIQEKIGFLRKGRLNSRAMAHFQRMMANYFTRYAHDKWYSLTKQEFKEYNESLPAEEKVKPIGEQE